jgi:hypothetical protein
MYDKRALIFMNVEEVGELSKQKQAVLQALMRSSSKRDS